ncbi:ATP-binding protein [Azospirillum canadense]|uniref:ATP-binding protein n=1 Tax=Azospirillum canadense TaxID=403962 RepID=UPI0022262128|nr:ATP-binding protein [Azospirillum canadense]MCW2235730.1 adenylate kinase family enzyme [Azospirillum canadense]
MPTVYMLMGPPGSGKTTWRSAFLAARAGQAVAVSRDDVVAEVAASEGVSYRAAWRAFSRAIDKEYRRRLTDAFTHGLDVVVDATNVTAKARRRVLSRVPVGWERVGVLFDAPDAVLMQRLTDRAAAGGPAVPPWLIAKMRADWVPPAPDEFDRVETVYSQ